MSNIELKQQAIKYLFIDEQAYCNEIAINELIIIMHSFMPNFVTRNAFMSHFHTRD